MSYLYHRTIRFADTDAAGVVYFANVLSICHEAYEASLTAAGINLPAFFGGKEIAVPIVHAEIDFRQPMFCGEQYAIQVLPTQQSDHKFEIAYTIAPLNASTGTTDRIAQAKTIHVCIHPTNRTRQALPKPLLHWLQLNLG